MRPTMNRLLVKVDEKPKGEEKTSIMIAKVLAIGPDVKEIKVKDTVIFSPYGFDEVVIDKKRSVIISEELILAVHEKKSNKKA